MYVGEEKEKKCAKRIYDRQKSAKIEPFSAAYKRTPAPPSSHIQAQASPGLTPGGGRPDLLSLVHVLIVNLA